MKQNILLLLVAVLYLGANAQSVKKIQEGAYGGLITYPEEQFQEQNWEEAKKAYINILNQDVEDQQLYRFATKRVRKIKKFQRQEDKWTVRMLLGAEMNVADWTYRDDLLAAILEIEKSAWAPNQFLFQNEYDTLRSEYAVSRWGSNSPVPKIRAEFVHKKTNILLGIEAGYDNQTTWHPGYGGNGEIEASYGNTFTGLYGSKYGIYEGSYTIRDTFQNTVFTYYVDSFTKFRYSFTTLDLQLLAGYSFEFANNAVSIIPRLGVGLKRIKFNRIYSTHLNQGYIREQSSDFLFRFNPYSNIAGASPWTDITIPIIFVKPGVSVVMKPFMNYSRNIRNINVELDFSVKGVVFDDYSALGVYHGVEYDSYGGSGYPLVSLSFGYSF